MTQGEIMKLKSLLNKTSVLLLLFLFLFMGRFYCLSENLSQSAQPDWVKSINFEKETAEGIEESEGGFYCLLLDNQINVDEEKSYLHVAYKIISDAGVQNASEIDLFFDPSYQKLFIHKIGIIRDDKYIDKMDMDKFKVLQREKDLERNVYDGTCVGVLFLEDVRKGDIIEYSYSVKGRNPIFDHRFSSQFYFNYQYFVQDIQYRLIISKKRKLNFRNYQCNYKPEIKNENGSRIYTWKLNNIQPVKINDFLPIWYNPYSFLMISEFENWKNVAQWAGKLYTVDTNFNTAFKTEVQELSQSHSSKEDQLLEAARFVQDKIRYMAVEVGERSHRPNHPNQVLTQRFGDCKDKTILLCSLLKNLNIDAYPVLINSYIRGDLTNYLPSPNDFNHVIALAKLNGREYWIDPTYTYQGGDIDSNYFPDYRKGLIISGGESNALADTPGPKEGLIEINETLTLQSMEKPVSLKVITTNTGIEADQLRLRLENTGQNTISKKSLNYYAAYYPGTFIIKPINIQDDRNKNIFVTEENYSISNFWQKDKTYYAEFSAQFIKSYLALPKDRVRNMPLGLQYPVHIIQNITVNIPEDWYIEPASYYYDDDFMTFGYHITYENKTIHMRYEYRSLSNYVPTDKITEYMKNCKDFEKSCNYNINWKSKK